jgi:two-component system LytT family sensor kinase
MSGVYTGAPESVRCRISAIPDMNFDDLLRDRSRLFWVLDTGGWAGYGLASYLGALVYEKPDAYSFVIAGAAVTGFLLSLPMRLVFRRLWSRSPLVIAAGVVAVCYVLALAWRVFINQSYWTLVKDGWQPTSPTDYIGGVMGSFYILLCWSGLYFGIKYYLMLQQQTEKTLRATAAAHQAQLSMLRYQLNPHFLFNTLNAISTLILDHDNDRANRTVMRLSDFLRHTLDDADPMKLVPLEQELRALDLYLEIEKVRFGDRLTVERDVEPVTLQALVPSLVLQPLIENAIKYAISPMEDGGTIRITARREGARLALSVADTGPGLEGGQAEKKSSCGVGLRNVRERLRHLYGAGQSFALEENEPRAGSIRT